MADHTSKIYESTLKMAKNTLKIVKNASKVNHTIKKAELFPTKSRVLVNRGDLKGNY
jgi:hypothetical protein